MGATVARVLLVIALGAAPLSAEVVRIEVQSRSDLVGGQAFGAAGPYEKLSGKIFFAVDPRCPRTVSSPTSTRRREMPPARLSSPPTFF